MIAAFLRFESETVLVVGLTPRDVTLLATGSSPPMIDIAGLAQELGAQPPTRLQVLFGLSEAHIEEMISETMGTASEGVEVAPDRLAQYLDEGEVRPQQTASEAEELAIKKAKAKYN